MDRGNQTTSPVTNEDSNAQDFAAASHSSGFEKTKALSSSPVIKVRPTSGGGWLAALEIWSYRDLLWSLALRDLKLRYRQTALGVLWVVFQPLAGAGIFAVVFGWVAGLGAPNASYFLFSLAGLLVWNAFQATLGKASMSLIGNSALVSKVYFPRLLLPFSTVLSSLVDFVIGLGVFGVAALFMNVKVPVLGFLMLPLWLGGALLSALGLGLLASSVMSRFRDVQHVLPVLLPFMMYASPVAYEMKAVPSQWKPLFQWNPMSWVLEGGRAALLSTEPVPPAWGIYALGFCSLVFALGLFGFRKMERTFADVL
jgi:lipopolysaccharide transport system permease protein